jgi:predicted NAD/FAD-dependent oxidoreductase
VAFVGAVSQSLPIKLPKPRELISHCWRHAKVEQLLNEPCLSDSGWGVGYCGDAWFGPRVEAALLSGIAVAGRVFHSEPMIRARAAPPSRLEP